MRQSRYHHLNNLWIARKHIGLAQKSVARLLGHHTTSAISEYEAVRLLPNLRTALRLAVIYRTPIAELYAPLYGQVEREVADLGRTRLANAPGCTHGPVTYESIAPKRILAVDPGMQYLGVAIIEGENLLWYAVKTFPESRTLHQTRSQVHQYLSGIIERYRPSVMVVEEPFYAQSLLSANLCKLTADLKTWGKWKGLKVRSYYPAAVKAFFCRDQQTKQSLAEAMIERYPFLRRYLTDLPWRRRYWFHVFDAIGLGLMCQRKIAR